VSIRGQFYAASGANTPADAAAAASTSSGSDAGVNWNHRAIVASSTLRRRMISRRCAHDDRQHFANRQNAGSDRCSTAKHPPITTRSRIVIGSQYLLYSPAVEFLIRIRNRFFTECMLIAGATLLRRPGTIVRTCHPVADGA
jgi:hypothetical protein